MTPARARRRVPHAGILLVVMAACCAPVGPGKDGEAVDAETVHQSAAGCDAASRAVDVLRDDASWTAWWTTRCPGAGTAPRVDFGTRVVVAVTDAPGPSDCYGVELSQAWRHGTGYRILAQRRVPLDDAACEAVVVHPVHVVALPRARGPVEILWRTVRVAGSGP